MNLMDLTFELCISSIQNTDIGTMLIHHCQTLSLRCVYVLARRLGGHHLIFKCAVQWFVQLVNWVCGLTVASLSMLKGLHIKSQNKVFAQMYVELSPSSVI